MLINYQSDPSNIHVHLNMMQDVIKRMASNSASCKTWCITLVAAVLVIIADKGKPEYAHIAWLPVIALGILDFYYLWLENRFRLAYNNFVSKLNKGEIKDEDFFVIKPEGGWRFVFKSLVSVAILGFYGALAIIIFITQVTALTSSI